MLSDSTKQKLGALLGKTASRLMMLSLFLQKDSPSKPARKRAKKANESQ